MSKENTLKEDALKGVVGGSADINGLETDGNCYFKAAANFEKTIFDGQTYVRCESSCHGLKKCSCFGSTRCKDKYHRVEKTAGTMWGPSPPNANNHNSADKQFNMQ